MKRWLTSLLAFALALSLAGCGAPQTGGVSDPLPPVQSGSLDRSGDLPQGGGDRSQETTVPDNTDLPQAPEVPDNSGTPALPNETEGNQTEGNLPEEGSYTSKEDVALYLYQYGRLPDNFITKKEAQALGWSGGSLEPYAPGMCIGGDYFGNREGLLPSAQGRSYTECDIDTLGAGSRGAKRIVFSNDGLIYYTEDHYESFELLYGDPEG